MISSRPWYLGGTIGSLSIIAVWWISAVTLFSRTNSEGKAVTGAIPTPIEVIQQFGVDGFEFYFKNASITLAEAGIGFVLGNL